MKAIVFVAISVLALEIVLGLCGAYLTGVA